jgi:hypothetical protein
MSSSLVRLSYDNDGVTKIKSLIITPESLCKELFDTLKDDGGSFKNVFSLKPQGQI